MADTKLTALTGAADLSDTDLFYVVQDVSTTPASYQLPWLDFKANINSIIGDWISANETWTYASADSPTFTFTISGDLTSKYSAGMRIKLTQTTVKYFIITAVSYGAPNTTITIYGGTDYTLTNAAISANHYSTAKAPLGFPLDHAKWTVTETDTADRAQTTPGAGTWYNQGTTAADIFIPIGAWIIEYSGPVAASDATTQIIDVHCTLSTANNSESNVAHSCGGNVYTTGNTISACTHQWFNKRFPLTVTVKTQYYFNTMTNTANVDTLRAPRGTAAPLVIRAICAYI